MGNSDLPDPRAPRARVLVVDGHPVLREGLAQSLAVTDDFEVCGGADSAAQALQHIADGKPDAVIVDLTLDGKTGVHLIRDIKARHPELPILVLSMHDEALYAERALQAGASGYVMKTEPSSVVVEALRKVLSGGVHVSDAMSDRLLNVLMGGLAGVSPVERLTARESEIFGLIGRGFGTRQIADRLHRSVKTMETHRAHIKEKLGLKDANELTLYAIRWMQDEGTS